MCLLRSKELLFGWVFIVQNGKAICGVWQGALDVTPAPAPAPRRLRIRGNLWVGLVLCGCVRKILKAQSLRPATPPPGAETGKHQHTHPPQRYPVRLAPAPAAPLSLLPSPPLTYTALNTYPNPRGGPPSLVLHLQISAYHAGFARDGASFHLRRWTSSRC